MRLMSSESSIASSPALTQTSCGPLWKWRLQIEDSSSNPNQALTIYGTLLTCISWLLCTVEHVETIWCGWWALNPVLHALYPLHKQAVDLCNIDTSMYDSSNLFCTWIHHLPSQLSIFVLSSSHNLWYFVGLNFLIAMSCRAGENYLMWMISSKSNIACSPALTRTSCGPCKIETSIRNSSSNPNQPHHFVGLNFLLSHVEN